MKSLRIAGILSIVVLAFVFGWNNLFVSKEERSVEPFHAIYAEGPINVFIEQAETASIGVKADTNILEKVKTEVVDGELRIYTEGPISGERVLDVYVTFVSVDTVHGAKQSTITGRGTIRAPKLKIKASGSSELKLLIESEATDLIMNDNANVQLAGTTQILDVLITKVGDLMAYNLISQDCKIVVDTGDQSPGIARINVQESLDVTIKGPRHVKYKGDAEVIQESIEGTGKLIKH